MTALPVSARAMTLASGISSAMVGEDLKDIREALAFALAGFISLGGGDEDEETEHFLMALANSLFSIQRVRDAAGPKQGEETQ